MRASGFPGGGLSTSWSQKTLLSQASSNSGICRTQAQHSQKTVYVSGESCRRSLQRTKFRQRPGIRDQNRPQVLDGSSERKLPAPNRKESRLPLLMSFALCCSWGLPMSPLSLAEEIRLDVVGVILRPVCIPASMFVRVKTDNFCSSCKPLQPAPEPACYQNYVSRYPIGATT